jgi:hypothetical protein
VYHQGFTEEQAAALGERLIRGEPLEHVGSWVIADIASARSHYGKLGAVYAQEEPFFPEERQLLVAYARQAAAALDAATALEEARGRHATSRALLQLAEALANLATPEEVAERIAAAVPGVVAADRSTVSLWDGTTQRLSTVVTHGWPPDLEPMIEEFTVRPSDTPELAEMLTDFHPRCYRAARPATRSSRTPWHGRPGGRASRAGLRLRPGVLLRQADEQPVPGAAAPRAAARQSRTVMTTLPRAWPFSR